MPPEKGKASGKAPRAAMKKKNKGASLPGSSVSASSGEGQGGAQSVGKKVPASLAGSARAAGKAGSIIVMGGGRKDKRSKPAVLIKIVGGTEPFSGRPVVKNFLPAASLLASAGSFPAGGLPPAMVYCVPL